MKLALVLGASSEKVKPRLQSVRDNLSIDCYKSVPMFIDTCLKRDFIYDRVLVLSTLINDSTLEDLHSYWERYCKSTSIVAICKKGTDESLAKTILETFVSTSVTVMLVQSTTVQVMAEGVLLSIQELANRYGMADYLSIETDDGFEFSNPNGNKVIEPENKVTEPESHPVKQDVKTPSPKAKKSLLGALFGRKKSTPKVEVKPTVNSTDVPEEGSTPTVNESEEGGTLPTDESVSSEEEGTTIVDNDFSDNTDEVEEPIDSELDTELDSDFSDSTDEVEEPSDTELDSDFSDSTDEVEEPSDTELDDDFSDIKDITTTVEDTQESDEVEEPIDTTVDTELDDTTDEDSGFEYEEIEEKEDINTQTRVVDEQNVVKNDFEPDIIDMDFGDTAISVDANTTKPEFNYQRTEVGDDLFDNELVETEEAYRTQEEKPVVIEKEVVKEIVRNVGGTVNTVLSGVLSGKLHKTVVVTGDRGSGVTLAAYTLAKKFAEKVPVLYVDCDTERHGLLSYIDYDTFRSYEEQQRDSINRCRSPRAFENCVCRFDVNIDLLTSDYCYDTPDSAIELMQAVVTEYQMDYGVVIVDCPISKLHLISDLIVTGNVAICVEGTKRGIMNMLCSLELCDLPLRYKRSIVSKGLMLFTKMQSKVKPENVIAYGDSIFEPDDCNWLKMSYKVFNGTLTKDILEDILEG